MTTLLKPPPRRFTHPDHGWAIEVPHDWDTHLLADPTRPWVAIAPSEAPRTTLVVTTDAVVPGGNLLAWQEQVEADYHAGVLQHYQPIDARLASIPAGLAYVRVAHHLDEYARSLTVRQWCVVAGGLGYTVTATSATLAQETHLAEVERAVASFTTGQGA